MGEISLAIRSLLRSKLFAAVAILTLVIGIGATTAVFTVFHAVVLRPLPFAEPDRLVDVEEWSATELCAGCAVGVSSATLADFAARATSFESIAAYQESPMNLGGGDGPQRVSAAYVTGNFFRTLGLTAALGRAIDPGDERAGAPSVVVLGDRLFRSRFGADSSVVGRSVRLNGRPITVVGVMPATAVLPEFAQLWTVLHPDHRSTDRTARDLGVIARLKPDATQESADAEIRKVAADLAQAFPETQRGWTARVRPLRYVVSGEEGTLYAIMLGAVLVLWAIVCANLAALLLSRGVGRRRELAVRLALGADRAAILWHLFAESLVLAVAGGVLGALAAAWAVEGVLASLGTAIPSWLAPRIDGSVLAFCLLLSLLSAAASGLFPAFRATRLTIHEDLKSGGPGFAGGSRTHARAALVALQLTLSLVLLAVSGVLSTTVRERSTRQVTADANVVQGRVEPLGESILGKVPASIGPLVDRLNALPNVRSAAASSVTFIAGFGGRDVRIRAEGVVDVPEGVSPRFATFVTPRYFETMSIQLAEGRTFTADERDPVVIINQRLANRLWPGRRAVGRRIKLGADSLPWRTIVGITADGGDSTAARVSNSAFVPFSQSVNATVTLLAAPRSEPTSVVAAMREIASQMLPDVPVQDLMTVADAHSRTWRPYRVYAMTLTAIGGLALLLASIGLYGIVAYSAEQRTREIGVRIALGATRLDVVRLISGQALRIVAVGLALGVGGSFLVAPVTRSLLFGASPFNMAAFGVSAALLLAVAALASYLPARRAAATDPMVALRSD